MSRLSFALVLLVGLLAGGLGSLLLRPASSLSDGDVRGIITDMLKQDKASAPATAEIDPDKVQTLVENYLMSDPTILQRMNDKLAEQKQVAARKAMKDEIDAHAADIYQSADNIVLGKPFIFNKGNIDQFDF